ncbi:MAG TPA: sodium:proton antiporter [Bacteroidota bacterium]|nr:sodium:proton antiporter [Bacteroidota bacterium]
MSIIRAALKISLLLSGISSIAFAGEASAVPQVPSTMILPFAVLLAAIAVVPFVHGAWWKNNYPAVAVGLGVVAVAWYLLATGNEERILESGKEYVSFVVLIGSLFIVSGGILLRISGNAGPFGNLILLATGAVAANILGTTGASIILIRPYLHANKYRLRPFHIVFFIFVVSNMGGALTPIGDPPIFLGYLKGIPFFWVLSSAWYMWLLAIGIVLAVFFAVDYLSFRKFETSPSRIPMSEVHEEAKVNGLHNVFFLAIIVLALFIGHPLFFREFVMILAAVGSYFSTKNEIHKANAFTFAPLKEVAILFVGIFATLVPVLDWIEMHAASSGISTPGQFFWGTGLLSSMLDNAPTYLNSLSASVGLFVGQNILSQVNRLVLSHGSELSALTAVEIRNTFSVLAKYHGELVAAGSVPQSVVQVSYLMGNRDVYLKAISLSAVFFGAGTYIGNGPNFMVKAIAEEAGAVMPSFFGYVGRYAVPVLLPTFILVWFVFFRS